MTDATSHDVMAYDPGEDLAPDEEAVDVVRSGLESDDDRTRTHAARVAVALAKVDPVAVRELVPTLTDALDDEWNVVVYRSTATLMHVAREDPARLESAVPPLVELLGHDLPLVRTVAARTLGFVALDHPEFLTEHVDALIEATSEEPSEILDADQVDDSEYRFDRQRHHHHEVNAEGKTQQVLARDIAANLLVEVARHDPTLVRPHVPRFVELLADSDAGVVAPSADVLGTIARDDPDAVSNAVEPLRELLDHVDESVVANAVAALGFVGDPAAIDPLSELANDEERDEELRELAAETAEFLDADAEH